MNSGANLLTLADQTAIVLSGQYDALSVGFLMTHLQVQFLLKGATANEGPLLVAMFYGASSLTDVQETITRTIIPRLQQDRAAAQRMVLKVGIHQMMARTGGDRTASLKIDMGFGKGIPFPEEEGLQFVLFNDSGSALTTGAQVFTHGIVTGVLLD